MVRIHAGQFLCGLGWFFLRRRDRVRPLHLTALRPGTIATGMKRVIVPPPRRCLRHGFGILLCALLTARPACGQEAAPGVALVQASGAADVVIDPADYPVVRLAANLLADDVARVTGQRPAVRENTAQTSQVVLIGTLGHSAHIDALAQAGKLARADALRGGWETTLRQTVDHPWPGVDRALVIAGSDRRGAAYGAMEISEQIGVSPWYWWADVPVKRQATLTLPAASPEVSSPSVKYRGIFINDEDWGLEPWAAKTFDPAFKNIGPKTYAKVFELMLRLRLNYLWPAMHPCSREFASVPANAALADQYAIVMGSSHCEPMLQNNVWWPHDQGPWRYDQNRDRILAYWEQSAKDRGKYEAVWTEGIRGIHDAGMQGPPDVSGRVALLQQTIVDQREIIARDVSKEWGPVAQCFIPYKEVQPLYDAGLEVPPDVTLVWADDNFGYLRRLSNLAERQRPGGAGIYYHLSYLGGPQSYLWLDTTPPALIAEETRKAWDNGARTIWIVNVGDIKPGEVGIDFWARRAWNIDGYGPDAQPRFLRDFAQRTFGAEHADQIAALYGEYYRLGQIRKPEGMTAAWADSLAPEQAATLLKDYGQLLDRERGLAATVPAEGKDAWTELAGYPAQMLAASGLVFLEDRLARTGPDPDAHTAAVNQWREFMESETIAYNEQVAGGKWRHIMASGEAQGKTKNPGWASWAEIHWPWLNAPPKSAVQPAAATVATMAGKSVAASAFSRKQDQPGARWELLAGLGHSGQAMAVEPAIPQNVWNPETQGAVAPRLEYDFDRATTADAEAVISLLPTFRLYPGMKLRIAVALDGEKPQVLEVPGSSGAQDENGSIRRNAVRDNRVDLRVPFPQLAAGRHTLKIAAVDPGAVIDEIALP